MKKYRKGSRESELQVHRLLVLGRAQIIAFCGLFETTGFFQASSTTDGRGPREGQFSMKDSTESAEPGNYGVGFPNFGKVEDPEARKSKLAAELANGRLAMMAIIEMFFQGGLTGSAWGDWSLYTASPLKAESAESEEKAPPPSPPFDPRLEVGVLPPLDYFALSSVVPARSCKSDDLWPHFNQSNFLGMSPIFLLFSALRLVKYNSNLLDGVLLRIQQAFAKWEMRREGCLWFLKNPAFVCVLACKGNKSENFLAGLVCLEKKIVFVLQKSFSWVVQMVGIEIAIAEAMIHLVLVFVEEGFRNLRAAEIKHGRIARCPVFHALHRRCVGNCTSDIWYSTKSYLLYISIL